MLLKKLLTAVIVTACLSAQAQIENVSSIGAVKDKTLLDSWNKRYLAQNPFAVKGFFYGENTIKEILMTEGSEGLWTYKGIDSKGQEKIIFMAADSKGEVVGSAYDIALPCPPNCPTMEIASIGSKISEVSADQWMANYQNQNSGKVYGHLLGRKIFEALLAQKDAKGIFVTFGLDETNQEHLIIAGVNKSGEILLNASADQAIPCPPWCSSYSVVKVAKK